MAKLNLLKKNSFMINKSNTTNDTNNKVSFER